MAVSELALCIFTLVHSCPVPGTWKLAVVEAMHAGVAGGLWAAVLVSMKVHDGPLSEQP